MFARAKRGLTAAALGVVALTFLPGSAPASGGWAKVSTDDSSSIASPSLALAGPSVVGAWARVRPAGQDAETATFSPSPVASNLATSVKRTNAATGWQSAYPLVFGAASAPGGLQTMLSGIQDMNNANQLNGTSFAQRNADGSWAAPAPSGLFGGATSSSAVAAIAGTDGQTPIFVIDYGGGLTIFVGATGLQSSAGVNVAAATQLGPALEANGPRLGRDTAGRYWLAWYNSRAPAGVYVLQIDPATGQPIGTAALAPNSSSGPNFGNDRMGMPCNSSCRVVYHDTDAAGNGTPRLLSWAPGEAAATVVSGPAGTSGTLAAAARADGRVWVAWYDTVAAQFRAVLGDAKGGGGSPRSIGRPDPEGGAYAMRAIAAPDGSLVLVSNWLAQSVPSYAFWADVIPATPPVYSGPTKTTAQTVGDSVITLVAPKSCVASASTIIAKLFVKASKIKHKAVGRGRLKVKVASVDFYVDSKLKIKDKTKQFSARLVLPLLADGSSHVIRAKVHLKVHHGPARSRSIRSKFKICG